jgi:nucleoside-diphosphate-sugar epimerase
MNKNILIIGYGDIGNRLSKILKEQSANIYAVSRHGSLDQNIIKINWDWLSNSNLDLPKITFDSVIIIPKPSNLDENGYRDGFISSLANIINSLQNVDIKSVIAISSTRVYGDHQKGPINEETSVEPSDFRGRFIKDYELLLNKSFTNNLNILRFAGLYKEDSEHISHNRLNRDTAANIISFVIDKLSGNEANSIYNCSEDSEILESTKSIRNDKLKKAGFKF